MKKVTVIIPAYNKADYTRLTVDSVLAQTYPNIEVIVVDDGSRDQTPQAMGEYGNRIHYIQKTNGGACSARNEGIRRATGEYLAFVDCDDLYYPEKIGHCVDYLEKNPRFGFVYTAASFIDEHGSIVGQYDHPRSKEGNITASLILGNFICNSTVMIKRTVLDKAGYFDEKIFPPADWDLWLRLSQVTEAGYIKDPLTKYRVTDNYTFNRLELSRREELYVVDKFFRSNPDMSSKKQAYSNFYLRYALCDYLKKDRKQFWSDCLSSLKEYPGNMKVYAIALSAVVVPWWLKAVLTKKILRVSQK